MKFRLLRLTNTKNSIFFSLPLNSYIITIKCTTLKAAQIIEPNKPLKISEIDTPKPTGRQVLVKVKAVGVCHSDLHLWEGGYDTGDGFMKVTDRGVRFPVIPGHEIVGIVVEIGDSAEGITVDDDVLVYPWLGRGSWPT